VTTRFAQRFVLEREIGSGGMARVFLGKDAVLERSVAIKVLKPGHDDTDIAARFRREGRTSAKLAHPNIVQVYDAGEGELEGRETSYIVMEYVPGGDLKDLIDRKGRLSNEELARLGAGVAAGLAHAHERGVIHRDVKPHNVLLDDGNRPKLTDFGIARALDTTHATRTGSYLGTALYSSPEQLRGEKVTPKSDVYSLGVTFYQAATGETPFNGSPLTVAHQHVSEPPTPPKQIDESVSEDLDTLILDCLNKDPDDRPTADEVRLRLLEAGRGTYPTRAAAPPPVAAELPPATGGTRAAPPASPSGPLFGQPRRDYRRRRAPILIALVTVLLILLGVAAYASLGGDPNTAQNDPAAQNEQANQPSGGGQGNENNQDPAQEPEQPQQQDPAAQSAERQRDQSAGGNVAGDEQRDAGSEEPSAPSPEDEAAQALEEVYTTADDGDFEASFGLLSQGFRAREGVTSAAAWGGTFETLQSIEFEQGPDAQVSGGTATVQGVTIATHTDRTERNTATWRMVNEGGEWKLDDIISIETEQI
jgi:serine/threonine-protein kinase